MMAYLTALKNEIIAYEMGLRASMEARKAAQAKKN